MATLQDILRSSIDIFTATMHCPRCAKEGRPSGKDAFITFAGTRKKFVLYHQDRCGTLGFTPTLVFVQHYMPDHTVFYKSCGIVGCGVVLDPEDDSVEYMRVDTGRLPVKQFNALRQFKNDEQYII